MKNYAAIFLTTILILTASAGVGTAREIADSYFAGQVKISKPAAVQPKKNVSKSLTAPPNDNFAGAEMMELSAGVAILLRNNISASKEANEPNHAENTGGSSVWFNFTPTATRGYSISTLGANTDFDTTLAVYTGNGVGSLEQIGYNDDCYAADCGTKSQVRLTLTQGVTYRIAVDGYYNGTSAASGNFVIRIDDTASAFENNNIANAYDLGAVNAGSIAGTNFMATGETGEPGHANNTLGGKSVWFKFRSSINRAMTFRMTKDFTAEMAVYVSSVESPAFNQLTKIDDNADHYSFDYGRIAVNFYAQSGKYYFVAVDYNQEGQGTIQTGNFQLKFYQTKLSYSMKLDDNAPQTSLSVFRPSEKTWYSLRATYTNPNVGGEYRVFGAGTDAPIPADFDGDGIANYAVTRNQNGLKQWYILNSNYLGYTSFQWGLASDKTLFGDFDRDGLADAVALRITNENLVWYVRRSSDESMRAFVFGLAQDRPVIGDFDGDGATEAAVVRVAENGLVWYILKSSGNLSYTQTSVQQFGIGTDMTAAEDYDGDGKTDLAIFRQSTGTWYIFRSSDGQVQTTQFGTKGDRPQAADYDNDGKADLVVFRPSEGNWYLWLSASGSQQVIHWGFPSDIPVSANIAAQDIDE